MEPLLILISIVLYFSVIFGISRLSSRKADNESFFVGNRKSPWYVVAFAMIGAAISGVTFVSVPGMVAGGSFAYLQMVMGFAVGQVIIALILIPLFYRMNLTSIYGYLENRFGISSYKTGAWFFFISKMLGAAVRLFLVCAVLQFLLFDHFRIPFILNVAISVAIVWLYTYKGGVKTLIWTDSFKTLCLTVSVVMCICYIASGMGMSFAGMIRAVNGHDFSQIFFFDSINDRRYFFKQFLAGVFTVIATTGLDQDFMQKNLSCRNPRDSQKNLIVSGILQIFIILLFLVLGVLLYMFAATKGVTVPARSDELFPMLATGGYFPVIVGILFVTGLVSTAYAAAGSALTSLTTSFTIDILGGAGNSAKHVTGRRKRVHVAMAVTMGAVIILINLLNNTSVINAVYVLASYTYGPILGMFAFGILTRRSVRDRYIPLVAILSPLLSLVIDLHSEKWLNGYSFSYELLIMNALFTFAGFLLFSRKETPANSILHA